MSSVTSALITNTLQAQFLHFAGRNDEAVRGFEKAIELNELLGGTR